MAAKTSSLNEDRVTSTIHFINRYLRCASYQLSAKKCDSDFYVLTGDTVDQIINTYKNRAAQTALVIDDIGLQIINRLFQEGLKEITLCLTRVPVAEMDIVKFTITKTFPDIKVNVIHLNDIKAGMYFDLIISNPPYGKIGANITKQIIDTVDFKEYINLLPANDYKRNSTKDLFNYQSDMKPINNGFADAAVTTHVAKIHKTKVNNMTVDEFERSQYIDRQLDKYFSKLATDIDTYVDEYLPARDFVRKIGNETTVIFTKRDCANSHAPYSRKCNSYKWNAERSIDAEYLIENTAIDFNNTVSIEMLVFNTAAEKDNFVSFLYSRDGFRFTSKLFTAVNVDSRFALNKIFPKVDWTRTWTVEEILEDYDYTPAEVQAVMDDLVNFRGMDD